MLNKTYTVKELSKLSKVSIRTLHYYDQIDLLKPAYVNSNGYRYYFKKELLQLQQILFFKELGIELKKIKDIVNSDQFEQLSALISHEQILKNEISRMRTLLKTLNKTIKHYKGEIKMTDHEIYQGFDSEKQKEYERYLVANYGTEAKTLIATSHENTKKWSKKDWDDHKTKSDQLNKDLVNLIQMNLDPDSDEVQALVDEHYRLIKCFYQPTKQVYENLADLYTSHEDFKKYYQKYHESLASFLSDAMKIYAKVNL